VADSRISALTRLPEAAVAPTDLLPIADLSASETKAITAKDLLEGVVINMDAGSIPASKINFAAGLPSGSLLISGGDVVLGRTAGAGLAEEIACTAAGRALLAGVDAAAQRAAMGLGTLAARSGSWVDGSSFSGTSSGTNTGDQTITLTGPVTGTGTGTFATTITAGAVGSVEIAVGGVATANVADDAITALKLADQSCVVVGSTAPSGAGAFIGQGGFSTATSLAYTYTATGWVQNAGVQSVVITDANTPLSVTKTGTTDTTFSIDLDDQSANAVWAGPTTGAAAKPTFRALVGNDLPAATASVRGAVYPGAGLTVAADGAASLAAATPTILGGIKVPGPDLQVSAAGDLSHPVSALAPGSYAKVTTNATGHVVGGSAQLVDADIAELSADKLTSGTLPAACIGPRSITRDMLADYSSAFVQEGVPAVGVGAHPIGTFWLQESSGQISVWNGNSWMKTGASTLFNRNLRYGGTYDATTTAVTGVTQFGTAEGIAVGDLMPAADDKVAGLYFVASVPGTNASLAGGAVMDAGDWLLCHGTSAGWVRIDTLNSAGGGGGGGVSSYLDDLLDVTLTAPKNGDTLRFGANGQWVNLPAGDPSLQATTTVSGIVELATVAEAEAGTDAVRAVTPAGLKAAIIKTSGGASGTAPTSPSLGQTWTDTSKSPPVVNVWDGTQWVAVGAAPPDATTTVKGIIQLATAAEVLAGTDLVKAVTPKEAKDHYIAKNIALLAALP
jgi:hypothetical protein